MIKHKNNYTHANQVPNNYASCLTLLQAMGLLALLGLVLAWGGSFFSS